MDDWSAEMQKVQEQRARRERLRGLLARAEAQHGAQAAKLGGLRESLEKERKDVERLEGLSLTALFHTVLSSKQEQLEKERQELLRAKLHHDECVAAMTALEAEIDRLRGALAELPDVEAEHARLVARREQAVLAEGGERAQRLFDLADAIAAERSKAQELREAAEVGGLAFDSLAAVIDSLGNARSWGNWDVFGGGLITTAIKHSHIDESRGYVREAQDDLRRFESELADVDLGESIALEVSGFDKFADFMFDGLIFDWVVQSKINRSLGAAVTAQRQVYGLLRALDAQVAEVDRKIEELEAKRRRTIEQP